MININILTYLSHKLFEQQFDEVRFGERFRFYENSELDIEWDMVVVFEEIREPVKLRCRRGGLVFISAEPPWSSVYSNRFLQQFDHIFVAHKNIRRHPGIVRSQCYNDWHFGFVSADKTHRFTFAELANMKPPVKTRNISVITSSLAMMPMHLKRVSFLAEVKKALGELPGVSGGQPDVSGGQINVSGRQPGADGRQTGVSGGQIGENDKLANVSGGQTDVSGGQPGADGRQTDVSGGIIDYFGRGVNEVDDKSEALLDYRFHLCIENSCNDDLWTEKLADPILGFCVPLYIGCTNIGNYLPEEAIYQLDIDDPKGAVELIRQLLENPEEAYQRKLPALLEARRRILHEWNIFAMLVRFYDEKVVAPGRAEGEKRVEGRAEGEAETERRAESGRIAKGEEGASQRVVVERIVKPDHKFAGWIIKNAMLRLKRLVYKKFYLIRQRLK